MQNRRRPVTDRREILDTAASLIGGERQQDYGTPAENFSRIGNLWAEVLGVPVTAVQVALCMAQVKVARLINSPDHLDSWVDGAGYLALGGEIATESTRTPRVWTSLTEVPEGVRVRDSDDGGVFCWSSEADSGDTGYDEYGPFTEIIE
jgi:hypothetical protein